MRVIYRMHQNTPCHAVDRYFARKYMIFYIVNLYAGL